MLLATAEDLLIRLDLFWWDVWNEDTCTACVFEVVTYTFQVKKRKSDGVRQRYRVRRSSRRYGAETPDREQLEFVRCAFEGKTPARSLGL